MYVCHKSGQKTAREGASSSSSSSAQPAKKAKISGDDGEDEDDDDGNDNDDLGADTVFVAEDLSGVIEASNIIPRTKRRSALASGLVRASGATSSSSAKRAIDSDDEEGDF